MTKDTTHLEPEELQQQSSAVQELSRLPAGASFDALIITDLQGRLVPFN